MNQINPQVAEQIKLQKLGYEVWKQADEEAIDNLDLPSEELEALKESLNSDGEEKIL